MSRGDSVGLAKQAGSGDGGLGTKQTTMEYFVPVIQAGRSPNTEDMYVEETIGTPFPTDHDRGVQYFTPTFECMARSASLPRILSAFMGDPITSTPSGGSTSRNHKLKPVTNQTPRAHSILLNSTDPAFGAAPATDLFWDAIGNEVTFTVEPNSWIHLGTSWVAKSLDDTRPEPTVTIDSTRRFPFYELTAYITAASVGGGVETAFPLSRFALTYGLNVPTDDLQLGARTLYRVGPGNRSASLEFTPKTDLTAWYRRALALSPEYFKVRVEAVGPVIEGSITHKVEVVVFRCVTLEAPVDISAGDTTTEVPVTAAPSYDAGAANFIEVNVVNTVTAY